MQRDEEFSGFARDRQQRMYRQAYLLCGETEQARDLVQSTLLKLYRAWPRIADSDYLDAYAHKTLVRTFLDGRRKWRRERDLERLPDPLAPTGSSDLRLTLLAALAELPPRSRATVVLRYWEDLSIEQTADALDCTTGTVKAQSSRALSVLRDRLGADFYVLNER